MHRPTDSITHTTAVVTPVVEHWLEREVDQFGTTMKDRITKQRPMYTFQGFPISDPRCMMVSSGDHTRKIIAKVGSFDQINPSMINKALRYGPTRHTTTLR